MSYESHFYANTEPPATSSEYSSLRQVETHIPEVELEFDEGLPVKLKAGLRTYEVNATKETQSAEKFFSHTVERDAAGNITAVRFENEQAAMFFGQITYKYRSGMALSYLARATQDELDLAHMEYPGTPVSGIAGVTDKTLKARLIQESATGAQHDTRSALLLTPRDLLLDERRRLQQKARAYLPTTNPTVDNNQVNFPENDWYSNMTDEVLEWIEELQRTGVELTMQRTSIQTGQRPFVINNMLIGKIDASAEDSFYLEKEVSRVALFAAEALKMRLRPALYIYNTALFEEQSPLDSLTSKMSHFMNTRASQSRSMILMSDLAMQVAVTNDDEDAVDVESSKQYRILRNVKRADIQHETAHFVDPNKLSATIPQAEAFARSMEHGFSFKAVVKGLRFNWDYDREITPNHLYYIFSNNPEGLTAPEVYGVSSTFFCWLYEKLGPDALRIFYGRLSGSYFEPWGKGVQRLRLEMEYRKPRQHFRGNVLNCLDSLPRDHRWTWENSEQLVEEYIADVNRGIRTPKENVSSIAPSDVPTE
jgi:hypothetical protein